MRTTKGLAKRLAAGLLSLVMTLSLLPALSASAEATETDYVTDPNWFLLRNSGNGHDRLLNLSVMLRYQKGDAEQNLAHGIPESMKTYFEPYYTGDTLYIKLEADIDIEFDLEKQQKPYADDIRSLEYHTANWHRNLSVYGKKVIDLNGHTIKVKQTGESSGSLFQIQEGASLTVVDSKGSGKMATDTYIYKEGGGHGYFNLFEVNDGGELILNAPGAEFECGRSKKQWYASPAKNASPDTHASCYVRGQSNGTVVQVHDGKLTVAGGTLRGRGFSAISPWGYEWDGHYAAGSAPYAVKPVRCAAIVADGESTVHIIDGNFYGKGCADALRIGDNVDLTIESGVFDVYKVDKVALPTDHVWYNMAGASLTYEYIGQAIFGVTNYMDGSDGDIGIPSSALERLKAKGSAVEIVQSGHDITGDELDDADLNTDTTTKCITIRPKSGKSVEDDRLTIKPTNGSHTWNPTAADDTDGYLVEISLGERYFTEEARELASSTYRKLKTQAGYNEQEYYMNYKFTLYNSNGKKVSDLGELRMSAKDTTVHNVDLTRLHNYSAGSYGYPIEKWRKLDAGAYTVRCEATEVWKGEHTYNSKWHCTMVLNIRDSGTDLLSMLAGQEFKPDFEISHTLDQYTTGGAQYLSLVLTDETQATLRKLYNDETSRLEAGIPDGASWKDIFVLYRVRDYDVDGNVVNENVDFNHTRIDQYARLISPGTGAKVVIATLYIPQYKSSDDATIICYDDITVSKNFILLPPLDLVEGNKVTYKVFGYHQTASLADGQSAGLDPLGAMSDVMKDNGTFSWQWWFCPEGHDMYAADRPAASNSGYERYTPEVSDDGYVKLTDDGTYRLVATYQPNKDGSTSQEFTSAPIDVTSGSSSAVQLTLEEPSHPIQSALSDDAELTLNVTGLPGDVKSVKFCMRSRPDGVEYSAPVEIENTTGRRTKYVIKLNKFASMVNADDPSGEYTFRAVANCETTTGAYKKYKVYSNEATVIIEKDANGCYALIDGEGRYLGGGQSTLELAEKQDMPLYLDSSSKRVSLDLAYYPENATFDSMFEDYDEIMYDWEVVSGTSITVGRVVSTYSYEPATIVEPGTSIIHVGMWAGSSYREKAKVTNDVYFKVCVPVTAIEFTQPDYQSKIGLNYKDIPPTVKAIATCGVSLGNEVFDFTNDGYTVGYSPVYRKNGTSSDFDKVVAANDKGDVIYTFHLAEGQSFPLVKCREYSDGSAVYWMDTSAVKLTVGDVTRTVEQWGVTLDIDKNVYNTTANTKPNNADFKLAQDVFVKDETATYISEVNITTTEPCVGDPINENIKIYWESGSERESYGQTYKAVDVSTLSNVKTADGKSIILPYYSQVSMPTAETAGAPYTDASDADADYANKKMWAYYETFGAGTYESGTYYHEVMLHTNSSAAADGTKYYFAPDCKIYLNGQLLDFGGTTYTDKYGRSYSSLSFSYFYDVGDVNEVTELCLSGLAPEQGSTPIERDEVTLSGTAVKNGESDDAKVEVTDLIWFVDKNGNKMYDKGEEAKIKWKYTVVDNGTTTTKEISGYDPESTLWWDGTFLPGVCYCAYVEVGMNDKATRLSQNVKATWDGQKAHRIGDSNAFVVLFDADHTINTVSLLLDPDEPTNRDLLGLFNANKAYTVTVDEVRRHDEASDSLSSTSDISKFCTGENLKDATLTAGKYWLVATVELEKGYQLLNGNMGIETKVLINNASVGEFGYGDQQATGIYKAEKDGNLVIGYPFLVAGAAGSGVTVSGTVTSFGNETDTVTIQLIASGTSEPAYEKEVTGKSASYSIENVPDGTYTMKVMKSGHVTREYTVTVNSADVQQDAKLHLFGDINGDGLVNVTDVNLARFAVLKRKTLDAYQMLIVDANHSGTVDVTDVNFIRFAALKRKTLQ